MYTVNYHTAQKGKKAGTSSNVVECGIMAEHYAKRNNPVTEGETLYGSLHINSMKWS